MSIQFAKKATSVFLSAAVCLGMLISGAAVPAAASGAVASEEFYYLSDMGYAQVSNGAGVAIGIDKSASNNTLKVRDIYGNEKEYEKGLGMHAFENNGDYASITYNLEGLGFTRFEAYTGADLNGWGSITFEVLVDDEQRYFHDAPNQWNNTGNIVNVDITGASTLTLRVGNGGNGNNGDHADWCDARIFRSVSDGIYSADYLSDLAYEDASNGFGDMKMDLSAGNKAISIKDIYGVNLQYTKGIGMHAFASEAPAYIKYNIAGKGYSRFRAFVGADTSGWACVKFEVLVDGEIRYTHESPNVWNDTTNIVDVDVTDASALELRVYNNRADKSDNSGNAASWGGARLLKDDRAVIEEVTTYLSDMAYTSAENGAGDIMLDKSASNNTLKVRDIYGNEKEYEKGLGMHAFNDNDKYATVTYNIEGLGYTSFMAYTGADLNGWGSLTFDVLVDGVQKYFHEAPNQWNNMGNYVDIDVTGASTITLRVGNGGNGNNGDHADWCDARLIKPAEVNIKMENGAHLNVDTTEGISFGAEITITEPFRENFVPVSLGMVFAPVSALEDGQLLAVGDAGSLYLEKSITAQKDLSDSFTMYGILPFDIDETNFTTQYTARAFLTYRTSEDDSVRYYYASSNSMARSLATTAIGWACQNNQGKFAGTQASDWQTSNDGEDALIALRHKYRENIMDTLNVDTEITTIPNTASLNLNTDYQNVIKHSSDENYAWWDAGLQYARMVEIQHSDASNNGTLLMAFEELNSSNQKGYPIYMSRDEGRKWIEISKVKDDTEGFGAEWQPELMELPQALGDMPAGTLLCAGASLSETETVLKLWRSDDMGYTWRIISTIVEAGRNSNGVYEPELVMLDDGTLVCYYADESDGIHNQKVVYKTTSDGINWSNTVDVCASNDTSDRPGMPVVSRLGDGTYFMTYEIVFTNGNNYVYYKKSADGLSWGDPSNLGTIIQTTSGDKFVGGAYSAFTPQGGENGTLIIATTLQISSSYSVKNADYIISHDYGNTWTTVPHSISNGSRDNHEGYSMQIMFSANGKYLYSTNNPYGLPGSQKASIVFAKVNLH